MTRDGRGTAPNPQPGGRFLHTKASSFVVDDNWPAQLARWADAELSAGKSELLKEAMPQLERTLIRVALDRVHGRRQEAAKLLGWGRNTLTRKIRELGLD